MSTTSVREVLQTVHDLLEDAGVTNVWINQAPDNATFPLTVVRKINSQSKREYANAREDWNLEVMCHGRPRSAEVAVETQADLVVATLLQWVDQTAATNWFRWSESFDNTGVWVYTGSSITANAAAGPTGELTADKLVESGTTNARTAAQFINVPGQPPDASTACLSAWFKAAERTWARLRMLRHDGSFMNAYFDLTAASWGTVDAGLTTTATADTNGWYRLGIGGNVLSGAGVVVGYFGMTTADATPSYTGDGTSGLYLWGAQAEPGLVPGPYIPTTTIAFTNAAQQGLTLTQGYTRDSFAPATDPFDRELVTVRILWDCVSWPRYLTDVLT